MQQYYEEKKPARTDPDPENRKSMIYRMYGELIEKMKDKAKKDHAVFSPEFTYALELVEHFFGIRERLATVRVSTNDKIKVTFIEKASTELPKQISQQQMSSGFFGKRTIVTKEPEPVMKLQKVEPFLVSADTELLQELCVIVATHPRFKWTAEFSLDFVKSL